MNNELQSFFPDTAANYQSIQLSNDKEVAAVGNMTICHTDQSHFLQSASVQRAATFDLSYHRSAVTLMQKYKSGLNQVCLTIFDLTGVLTRRRPLQKPQNRLRVTCTCDEVWQPVIDVHEAVGTGVRHASKGVPLQLLPRRLGDADVVVLHPALVCVVVDVRPVMAG